MKKIVFISCLSLALFGATDFSTLSTDELLDKRGSVSSEDREAFRAEMQKRIPNMTPEQLDRFQQRANRRGNNGRMNGNGFGNQGYKNRGKID